MSGLKYIGKDLTTDWLPGVPARDLTAEEAKRWPQAEASQFYRKASKQEPIVEPPAGHGEEEN